MPTYDYECDACGHAFEKVQPMIANAIKKCPKCGKNKARRLIGTGGGILFKGKGFYQTDYRSSKYNEAAKKDVPAPKECPAAGGKGCGSCEHKGNKKK
ncbi:MAG: zinc ribbon domain-containing protein [Candidatus Omnitrophota bacterium]|jgi:putative FmdB family regulatory protein